MDRYFIELAQYGALGIVAGVSLAAYFRLSNKLLSIIENNTRAFERLSAIIATCQKSHKKE